MPYKKHWMVIANTETAPHTKKPARTGIELKRYEYNLTAFKKNAGNNNNYFGFTNNNSNNLFYMSERGAYNKQVTHSDREMRYITNLSKSVGEACDRWLEKRGMKGKAWRQQNDDHFKRKAR
jgi:hypothetical protein